MSDIMAHRGWLLLVAAGTALLLAACGSTDRVQPPHTYNMGERFTLGHIVYVVYETQWLTQLGEAPTAQVPQNRYFLVRLSAVNGGGQEVTVPNFTIEDDNGHSYPELSGEVTRYVPQYIGFLRRVRPAEAAQGHAVFDAPPRHYKLRVLDEDGERSAYVDIPLSFTSESPDVPSFGDPKKDQPQPIPPLPAKK